MRAWQGLPDGFPTPTISSGVGQGWWPIVVETDQRLRAIDPNYTVDQVKEKFGTLSYYISSEVYREHRDDFNSVLTIATQASRVICEVCGAPGTHGNHGGSWLKTLCDEHSKKWQEGRRPWQGENP